MSYEDQNHPDNKKHGAENGADQGDYLQTLGRRLVPGRVQIADVDGRQGVDEHGVDGESVAAVRLE